MPHTTINDTQVIITGDFLTLIQGTDVIVFDRSQATELKIFLDFEDF